MPSQPVVPHEEWLAARRDLLAQEKEFTRQRDELSRLRRAMPWERVEKAYSFEGPKGRETLAELFDGRGQLVVYHFMLGPEWEEGCPSCSMLADHYDPVVAHLQQRDVTLVTVSRAPLAKIEEFKKRMGWRFKWVSSSESSFNFDFGVSFTREAIAAGPLDYNYGSSNPPQMEELPGLSVFARGDDGAVYHTYSTYARGLDLLLGVYNFLDLVPKGRDEEGLPYTMAWVKHRDRYDGPEVHQLG